eukprot:SAG22_NODE_141_length_17948_cov_129.932665_4_plen_39_part_00
MLLIVATCSLIFASFAPKPANCWSLATRGRLWIFRPSS